MSDDGEDHEIVIRGVNEPTFEAIVDALDESGVNTEVVRHAE